MADAITIKALQDASLDAKSLEEVVNGNEAKQVTTRLGETYPSIKKAFKTMFENGGLPATPFETKALMTASALVDGDYAQVTDDTANNGLYVKAAGAWVKSDYDPILQSKEYADDLVETANTSIRDSVRKLIPSSEGEDLLGFVDKSGELYARFDNKGRLHLSELKSSVQDSLSLVGSNDSNNSLFEIRDKNNNPALILNSNGELIVEKLITNIDTTELISSINNNLESLVVKNKAAINLSSDGRIAEGQSEYLNKISTLVPRDDYVGYGAVFAPCIRQIAKNKFYVAYDVKVQTGDYIPIFIGGRIVDYDPDTDEFTSSNETVHAMHGNESDGTPYSFLNPNVTFVESGVHAGRILVHFNFMTNPDDETLRRYAPYYTYSDDGGLSFSDPIDMSQFFDMDKFVRLNFGPGHGIQIKEGEHKGRLLLPAYSVNPVTDTAWASRLVYSDDGGETYAVLTTITDPIGLCEWQIAECTGGKLVGMFRMLSGRTEKYFAESLDGGVTFTKPRLLEKVAGAGTKIGFTQCKNSFNYANEKLLAMCPRSPDVLGNNYGRIDPHIWVSYDDGETWSEGIKLSDGTASYTEVIPLTSNKILCLWSSNRNIESTIINLKTLLGE